MAPSVILNIATLARINCIHPGARGKQGYKAHGYHPNAIFGSCSCTKDDVIKDLLPFLVEKLEVSFLFIFVILQDC